MNPTETTWLTPLFGLNVIPGAHDTLQNIFSVNADGHLSSFLSANRQLDRMAGDALSALSIPGGREFTDDDQLIRLRRLVIAASAVHLPFHADERVMAELGGVVVCAAQSTTAASRRLPCEG